MFATATVSFVVDVPVTKVVDDTVVVQLLTRSPRVSATVTEPSWPAAVAAPVLTVPVASATVEAGTVMASAPAVRVKVAVVLPLVAAWADPATPTKLPRASPVVRASVVSFEPVLMMSRFRIVVGFFGFTCTEPHQPQD